MKRTVRYLVLALVLVLTLSLLTGCAGTKSTEEAYAAAAWKMTARKDVPANVGVIHYTDISVLTSRMQLSQDTISAVPSMGYAYVFAPNGSGFSGLHIVFVDELGHAMDSVDYDALYLGYTALTDENPAQQTAYLNACNYVAFMYAEMLENATPVSADMRMNQWYQFSQEAIAKLVK